MDDGTNIQARPSPTVFEIVISGLLIARARARHTFALLASELREIAIVIPYRSEAAVTFALSSSVLRTVIVQVGAFASGAASSTFALVGSELRSVVVQAASVSSASSNTLGLHSSALTVVARAVTPSRDSAAFSFGLTGSVLS